MLGASLRMKKNESTPSPGIDDPSTHIDSLRLRLSIIHKDVERFMISISWILFLQKPTLNRISDTSCLHGMQSIIWMYSTTFILLFAG